MKRVETRGRTRTKWFPILGGRLLKKKANFLCKQQKIVSNPWREAIEVSDRVAGKATTIVSNPWREAIEAC